MINPVAPCLQSCLESPSALYASVTHTHLLVLVYLELFFFNNSYEQKFLFHPIQTMIIYLFWCWHNCVTLFQLFILTAGNILMSQSFITALQWTAAGLVKSSTWLLSADDFLFSTYSLLKDEIKTGEDCSCSSLEQLLWVVYNSTVHGDSCKTNTNHTWPCSANTGSLPLVHVLNLLSTRTQQPCLE